MSIRICGETVYVSVSVSVPVCGWEVVGVHLECESTRFHCLIK